MAGMVFDSRLAIFKKAAEIMSSEKFELAAALTMDAGKNRYEAVSEVDEAGGLRPDTTPTRWARTTASPRT